MVEGKTRGLDSTLGGAADGSVAAFLLTMMLQPHQIGEFLIWLAPFFLLLGLLAGWGISRSASGGFANAIRHI